MKSSDPVFDRALLARHRDRASPRFEDSAFLFTEIAARLQDRLDDIRREFPLVLNLGAHDGALSRQLSRRPGVRTCLNLERSPQLAQKAAATGPTLVADEEILPFHGPVFDLIISNMALHWANDLPGALLQARRALKPDGLFLAALLGGETLSELRQALLQAELEQRGGAAAHTSPLLALHDAAHLLQRAGFALPTADREKITVTYENPQQLLCDLRQMGATHAPLSGNRHPLRRNVWLRAGEIYRQTFAEPDGRIPATFEFFYLCGWAPHESQPQALRPGSATHSLAEALKPARE